MCNKVQSSGAAPHREASYLLLIHSFMPCPHHVTSLRANNPMPTPTAPTRLPTNWTTCTNIPSVASHQPKSPTPHNIHRPVLPSPHSPAPKPSKPRSHQPQPRPEQRPPFQPSSSPTALPAPAHPGYHTAIQLNSTRTAGPSSARTRRVVSVSRS